jgi:LemA protein
MEPVLLVVGVAALAALSLAATHRGLARARARVDASWRALDEQLRRRHELADALLAAGGPSAQVEALVDARRRVDQALTPFARAGAERRLAAALQALLDDLDDADGQRLHEQAAALDREIQAARRIYNADVRLYLTRRRRLPGRLLRARFEERPYFELDHTRQAAAPKPVRSA